MERAEIRHRMWRPALHSFSLRGFEQKTVTSFFKKVLPLAGWSSGLPIVPDFQVMKKAQNYIVNEKSRKQTVDHKRKSLGLSFDIYLFCVYIHRWLCLIFINP